MKRSEAKLEIFYTLEKQYSHPEANIKIAEEILSALEEAGMLPPRAKLGTLGIEDNAWEPEDG